MHLFSPNRRLTPQPPLGTPELRLPPDVPPTGAADLPVANATPQRGGERHKISTPPPGMTLRTRPITFSSDGPEELT